MNSVGSIIERLQALGMLFRPSGPIDRQDLFSGRTRQLAAVADVCAETGRHAVIYGERGVGKTSLAAVSSLIQTATGKFSLRINCDAADTFTRIWEKVIDEMALLAQLPSMQLRQDIQTAMETAVGVLHFEDSIGPDRVRHGLQVLASTIGIVIFLDEFDRIQDKDARTLMADTIKTLSDQLVNATIILVGVANDVDALVAEHASIERALAQVQMPRMTLDEIRGIFETGFNGLHLRIAEDLMGPISRLPRGLPHYAHLIGKETARCAIYREADEITDDDFTEGLREAISLVDQSIARAYHDATASSRQTLFEEVLLACALANTDNFGFFAPRDIRDPLSELMGEHYDMPRFAGHLAQLCEGRGRVLERRGGERRWRYRFSNPMMQPYVLMRGFSSGKVSL
jgi:Cdc6-like AAA superfamily ATPase